MKIVRSGKLYDLTQDELISILKYFDKTFVDLGTGDGRYIYEEGKNNHKNLYIGVDPSETQLKIYARKAARKRLANTVFTLGSFEQIPQELKHVADGISIILPWGKLLRAVVFPEEELINVIRYIQKPAASLKIIIGYHHHIEPAETTRLDLPELTDTYIKADILPKYEKYGFMMTGFTKLERAGLKEITSSWAKKIAFGQSRPIFQITFSL